jgi:hypothetical protein
LVARSDEAYRLLSAVPRALRRDPFPDGNADIPIGVQLGPLTAHKSLHHAPYEMARLPNRLGGCVAASARAAIEFPISEPVLSQPHDVDLTGLSEAE